MVRKLNLLTPLGLSLVGVLLVLYDRVLVPLFGPLFEPYILGIGLYNLGIATFYFGAFIILVTAQIRNYQMDLVIGNEYARGLWKDGIPYYRSEYFSSIRNGDYSIVTRFWSAGMINLSTNYGQTDLHIASENGHAAIVHDLLRRGGDLRKTNSNGITPLMTAVERGHLRVVEELIVFDRRPNATEPHSGATALFMAAFNGHLQIVHTLLNNNADIDQTNNDNMTPLMAAVSMRRWPVANHLLNAGADVRKIDKHRANLMDYAVAFEAPSDLVERIRESGIERSEPPLKPRTIQGGAPARIGIEWKEIIRSAPQDTNGAKPKQENLTGASLAVIRDLAAIRDASFAPEVIIIPSGSFMMGAPKEKSEGSIECPQHEVMFRQQFAIGRYPVTFEEYDFFAKATARDLPPDEGWGRERRPVINVSWYDATAYAEWLSEKTGQPYRLPSEAEWEYSCRAGSTTVYWWGDKLTPVNANYQDSGSNKTSQVGEYPPSRWGLYDMSGNVWEWVQDSWNVDYEGAPIDGSAWTATQFGEATTTKVLRGGSWRDSWVILRSANRERDGADGACDRYGFRIARTLA